MSDTSKTYVVMRDRGESEGWVIEMNTDNLQEAVDMRESWLLQHCNSIIFRSVKLAVKELISGSQPKVRAPNKDIENTKKYQIIKFAENYLAVNGATKISGLVAALEAAGKGELIAGRKDKDVAISQALGQRPDLFTPSRLSGWHLNGMD